MKDKITMVSFKMDQGLKDLLDEYAKKTRQTKSRLIREALLREFSRLEEEKEKK